MRKKLSWLLFALGVLSTVAILAWTLLPHDRINKAAYDQIKVGMTKAEVEAVFGLPPGVYCDRDAMVRYVFHRQGKEGMSMPVKASGFDGKEFHLFGDEIARSTWIGKSGACEAWFNVRGKAFYFAFHEVHTTPLWERVKDWFAGLKW
jgi:hypothetical protein